MRKKKTIIIKNPKLRKVRNNLRNLFLGWGSKQLDDLFNTRDKIERNEKGIMKKFSELNEDEKEKIDDTTLRISRLRKIRDASICKCTVCGTSDKDMTYNPVKKEWFCVDCYKLNQDFYKDTDEAYLYP
ncbi:MAG: hypothetical protein ACXABO_06200 [Promethearchaeota archaeon]